jgi:hypothetical protein
MAEAQMRAVDVFIQSNPELFKSMHQTLKKSEFNDKHIQMARKDLSKDFERASERLMRDIFGAVKEDLEGRKFEKSDKSDKIPGGLADGKKPSDFDEKKLAAGIKIELEHTSDRKIAEEIAMDHLMEDKNYYDKLKTIEKEDFISEESMGDFLTDKDGGEGVKKKKKKRGIKSKNSKKD